MPPRAYEKRLPFPHSSMSPLSIHLCPSLLTSCLVTYVCRSFPCFLRPFGFYRMFLHTSSSPTYALRSSPASVAVHTSFPSLFYVSDLTIPLCSPFVPATPQYFFPACYPCLRLCSVSFPWETLNPRLWTHGHIVPPLHTEVVVFFSSSGLPKLEPLLCWRRSIQEFHLPFLTVTLDFLLSCSSTGHTFLTSPAMNHGSPVPLPTPPPPSRLLSLAPIQLGRPPRSSVPPYLSHQIAIAARNGT